MSAEHAVVRLSHHLAPLWSVLHARLSSGRPVRRVKVGPLTTEQQSALADLLGLARLPGEYSMVGLDEVDAALSDVAGCDVRTALHHLIGPIPDRSAERAAATEERNRLWEWLFDHEVVRAQPALEIWAETTRRNGLIAGSVERTGFELDRALRVLRRLPGAGVHLPVFAEQVLGDPHALDEGSRLHTMVIRALAALYDAEPPADAIGLRGLWARAGISDDELSSTVLVAGLPILDSDTVIGRITRLCAEAGVAAVLSLQQLREAGTPVLVADAVRVVENPSVLATALARFGPRCPPMVCISGWPSSAAVVLLDGVAQAGATLHYHGDFDGEGLRIAANLVARFGAVPWRMTSRDYSAAVGPVGPPVGRVTAVPWDADLSEELRRRGQGVSQERVIDVLLGDLAP
ncbi:TIGR02679 family protein [Nocardia sp. NPDC005366]|uniref:TIGR02679 family protein n=1 Tax=Nocardia sp. NPDC005366 TaxID=3156878 RepID=UPI0033BB7A60